MTIEFSNKPEVHGHKYLKYPDETLLATASMSLTRIWTESLFSSSVATHNPERFINLMLTAQETGRPLVLCAVGCLDWNDRGNRAFIGTIKTSYGQSRGRSEGKSRAVRTAEGIASLQSSLLSFGIETSTYLILSAAEANIAAPIRSVEKEIQDKETVRNISSHSLSIFATLIEQAGGQVTTLDELELLTASLGIKNLGELQAIITGSPNPTSQEFVSGLYKTHMRYMPEAIMQNAGATGIDPVGIAWLDLMSPLAEEHRNKLHEYAQHYNSDMPVITPFANSGKWHTKPVPQEPLPTRTQVVSRMLQAAGDMSQQKCQVMYLSAP
jgi:hypothetical protein